MASSVYIETTVVSYLTARKTTDIVRAAHQQLTQDWWDAESSKYELYTSQLVLLESGRGDVEAAQDRLRVLQGMKVLDISAQAEGLAEVLMKRSRLPAKAAADALHIAIATVNGLDYLLTWNCRHLANSIVRPLIEAIIEESGLQPPVICTPEELREVEP